MMSIPLAGLLAALLAVVPGVPGPAATAAGAFASLADLDAAMAELERGRGAEPFWERVKAAGGMPLIFGEVAVFLHRSKADKVEWRGDFTGWKSTAEATGRRLGESDVWTFRRTFLPRSRLDYKIVESAEAWVLDPLNPHRQIGGYGPNSEVRMPGWAPASHLERRDGVAAGILAPPELVESKRLGYGVNVRVYTPALPGGTAPLLPILYVTDGSDYWNQEMGGLVTTLDNLVAERRIPPLVVVFVDAWDPQHQANRREKEFLPNRADPARPIEACPFCEFLVDELAPRIESRFRIDAGRRGLLGTSYGGFHAALMGLRYPDRFRLLGIQSPAIGRQPWLIGAIAEARKSPRKVAIDVGLYEEWALAGARSLRDGYLSKGASVRYDELPDGHSWGHWRASVAPMLEFLYGER